MIKTFKCPTCGATMSYEGGPEPTLTCAFCGSVAPVPPELQAQAQPDSAHGFATHTPHPPLNVRRVQVDWRGLIFVVTFVGAFLGALAEIFAR